MGSALLKLIFFDYLECIISRINEVNVFFNKILKKHKLHLNRLFYCNHICYCVNMVSVTSTSRYITSASRYHPRYQSRSSMYVRGLIPRNFAELVETVPIGSPPAYCCIYIQLMNYRWYVHLYFPIKINHVLFFRNVP